MNRTELNAAKNALINAGWTHSHSVMADKAGQASNCFGLVFIKNGNRFYLNLNTSHMVEEVATEVYGPLPFGNDSADLARANID
jgi:hypothetical protein